MKKLKNKYVIFNTTLDKNKKATYSHVICAPSLKKAKEIAKIYLKDCKKLKKTNEIIKNNHITFAISIALNSIDFKKNIYYKEI